MANRRERKCTQRSPERHTEQFEELSEGGVITRCLAGCDKALEHAEGLPRAQAASKCCCASNGRALKLVRSVQFEQMSNQRERKP